MKITVKDKEYDLNEINITKTKACESETSINIMKDEPNASIYTSDNVYLTKIKRAIIANPEEWKITNIIWRIDGSISGIMATAPKKYISLRSKKNPGRLITEEDRVRAKDNITKWRQTKKQAKENLSE